MATNYVELAKSIIIDLAAIIIFAAIVTFGPMVATEYLGLDGATSTAIAGFVTLLAYQVLPSGSVNLFEALLKFLKGKGGLRKDDGGSTSIIAYLLVITVGIAGLALIVAVYVYHVDLLAALAGVVVLVGGSLAVLTGKQVKSWVGVTIVDGKAVIDWDLFDKSRVHVQAVPEGLLHIAFTTGGTSWDAMDCRFNNEDGFIYSLRADPTADNTEAMKNEVYLAMDKLPSPAALEYILEKIAAKGRDIKNIKAALVLGQDVVDKMSSRDYDDYVGDLNPEVNLTKGWTMHLKRDEYFLRREADDLYWKYYKK